jgi:DNA-binding XRE family transcriptional regulator
MPIILPSRDVEQHIVRARSLLGLSQDELAEKLEVSRRTVIRWATGQAHPSASQLHVIARMVHPLDEDLAELLAIEGGTTLASLGLVTPAPPPPVPVPPSPEPQPPPPRPFPPVRLMLHAVLHAAQNAATAPPEDVRAIVAAAFAITRGLGLTVEELDDALAGREAPEPEAPAKTDAPTRKRSAR